MGRRDGLKEAEKLVRDCNSVSQEAWSPRPGWSSEARVLWDCGALGLWDRSLRSHMVPSQATVVHFDFSSSQIKTFLDFLKTKISPDILTKPKKVTFWIPKTQGRPAGGVAGMALDPTWSTPRFSGKLA